MNVLVFRRALRTSCSFFFSLFEKIQKLSCFFFLYSVDVDVGGARPGDMNTANVDEDEEIAEDKDDDDDNDDDGDFVVTFVDNTKKKPPAPTPAAPTQIEQRDVAAAAAAADEEYEPSNDERDSKFEDINNVGKGDGTGKRKRKAATQNFASRASAKKAKKQKQPSQKRYLFFLRVFSRLFSKFFFGCRRVERELNRDEGLLFEQLRQRKASIDASSRTNKEKYEEFTTLLENLVEDLISRIIGEPLSCTKTALPGGGEGEWDENGEQLRNFDALVFGHFETAGHNLGGNLLATRSDLENDGLRATVWNLLWFYGVNLFNFVVTNIVPWAAPHDHGQIILSGIPRDVISFVNELTKAKLGCLGEPKKVAGFGAHVRTFANNEGYTNARVPWTFHFDSPHLSLFTTNAPRALAKEDYDAFGALVDFLDGREGAGEDLRRARGGEDGGETTREMIRARQSEASQAVWANHRAAGTLDPVEELWANHRAAGTLHPVEELWANHRAAGTLHPVEELWANHRAAGTLHPVEELWANHRAAGTLHPVQVGSQTCWRNHQAAGTLHPAQIGANKKAKDWGTVQIPPGFVCDNCGQSCEHEVSLSIDKRQGTFRHQCPFCKKNKTRTTTSYSFAKTTSIQKFFDGDGGRNCFNTSEKKKAFADMILDKINSQPGLGRQARRVENAMNEYFSRRSITSFFSRAPPALSLPPPPPPPALPPPAPISISYPSTFTSIRIDADGNCQFRAIADQLFRNQDRHVEVRQAVIYELESNRERYIDDLGILRVADRAAYEAATGVQLQVDVYQAGMREAMWNAYIAELRAGPDTSNTSYGWGDDITLRAAANFYSIRIQVYGASRILVENLNGTAERTLNVFCENSHYTSLRQSTEEEEEDDDDN